MNQPINSLTIDLPTADIPQAYDFEGEKIFVRRCYRDYYRHVMERLTDTRVKMLSVTGTPGIGKSAFYLYFLQRYQRENPTHTIVAAAWNKSNQLIRCVKIDPTGLSTQCAGVPKEADIYLYDGPPPMKQPGTAKMVAFTCPNDTWFSQILRDRGHRRIFMPVWTFPELQLANIELDLGIADEELRSRFALFGGSVRYCLCTDSEYLQLGHEQLMAGINNVTSLQDVENCFSGAARDLTLTTHRIMHYVLNNETIVTAELMPASVEVSIRLKDKIASRLDDDRRKLMMWLDGSHKASTFGGWLFENFVHEIFAKGGTFSKRSANTANTSMLTIPGTAGVYRRFKEPKTLDQILKEIYMVPEAPNLPSIDSYIIIGNFLYLFQITRNEHHPVGAEGIVSLLEKIGMLEAVKNGSFMAQLVFVVPASKAASYPAQNVEHREAFKLSLDELKQRDCGTVPGIAQVKKRKLLDAGIRNVGTLLTEYSKSPQDYSFAKNAIEKLLRKRQQFDQLKFLDSIPQFVIGIDYSVPSPSLATS